MKIDEKLEEKIINFGAFNYDTEKIASILNMPKSEIENEMNDDKSKFYAMYQKGKNMADYVIDLKLFELAKSGDIKALEKLDMRIKMRTKKIK